MTGEVLCEVIPVLPASVLFSEELDDLTFSKLFVSGYMDDTWKGFTYISSD